MKPLSIATLSVTLLAALAAPAEAEAQILQATPTCGDRPDILKKLDTRYSEAPVSMGLTSAGAVLEVLASDKGTWTIVVSLPSGMSCMIAAGEYWEDLPKPEKVAGHKGVGL